MKNYLKLNVKEKNIQIADQVIIDETAGEVVIGANTRICHGAVIQGPVVIGANCLGNDSNLLIVFYVQIMPDDFVMQLHRF
ncbi:hypothetical protein AM464_18770 [Escherichia coli]|nr:hypothetical protein AM464_18770 [Escherichia coli]